MAIKIPDGLTNTNFFEIMNKIYDENKSAFIEYPCEIPKKIAMDEVMLIKITDPVKKGMIRLYGDMYSVRKELWTDVIFRIECDDEYEMDNIAHNLYKIKPTDDININYFYYSSSIPTWLKTKGNIKAIYVGYFNNKLLEDIFKIDRYLYDPIHHIRYDDGVTRKN